MSIYMYVECCKYNCITVFHLPISDLPKIFSSEWRFNFLVLYEPNHTQIVYNFKFQFLCDKVGT